MFEISPRGKRTFFIIICAIIGAIMFYRGLTDFFGFGTPVRQALGLIFFGGVVSIFMMYRGLAIGFWLFCFFDFAVGYVFIFILEDIWQHHVLPHITYAAVFVPFYSDLRWLGPQETLHVLLGRKLKSA